MPCELRWIAAAFEYVSHFLVVKRNESTSRKEKPGLVVTILAENTHLSVFATKMLLNITGRGQKDTGIYDEQIAGHVVTL